MKGVVILDIVIMWLVENTVRVVIAVWIFISYPTNLAQLHMGIGILVWILTLQCGRHIWIVTWLPRTRLLCEVLTSQ